MNISRPSEQYAIDIVEKSLRKKVRTIKRFPTGLANYVYDVITSEGNNIVVRLGTSESKDSFSSAIYWYKLLKPIGIPLPEIHYSNIDEQSLPVIIMDRLEGEDLGNIYQSLNSRQKENIANHIVEIQNKVETLPLGKGYGYAMSYEDPNLMNTWEEVVLNQLERSRKRIQNNTVVSVHVVDKVLDKIKLIKNYLDLVEPKAFLDDTTTKNLMIHDGDLIGIVDVDYVCFGDKLFTIGLTNMSLISSSYDTDYIDFWISKLNLNEQQKKVLTFYTALFCVGFLAEIGMQFNKEQVEVVDGESITKLTLILNNLLSQI